MWTRIQNVTQPRRVFRCKSLVEYSACIRIYLLILQMLQQYPCRSSHLHQSVLYSEPRIVVPCNNSTPSPAVCNPLALNGSSHVLEAATPVVSPKSVTFPYKWWSNLLFHSATRASTVAITDFDRYPPFVHLSAVFFESSHIARTTTCSELCQSAIAIDISSRLSRSLGIKQKDPLPE